MATKPFWNRRRGVAMILVLLLGIVILVLGTAMITTSGGFFQSTVDAKQRIRSRYAAEAMLALQMATLDKLKDSLMAGKLNLAAVPATLVSPTGNGEMAQAGSVKQTTGGQQVVNTGDFKGLMGTKVSFLVKSTGTAPGGAKTNVQATLYLYQIPLFQFGVFYQGNIEITPGPAMTVQGPLHTNGNAYFRGYNGSSLSIQGPVTVADTIYHWVLGPPAGQLFYYSTPNTAPGPPQSGLTNSITAMTNATRPSSVNGVYNIDQGTPKLNLPIGSGTPHQLISPCYGSDAPALKNQKFDCLIHDAQNNRFVHNRPGTGQPGWITGDSVFFDRREDRWVNAWDVDVALALKSTTDSIFYLYDSVLVPKDKGTLHDTVINAFKLFDASSLSRNASFVSGNPIYLEGNFNAPSPTGTCQPADYVGPVPPSQKYCNAMIASDAFTVLSPSWANNNYATKAMTGTLEQPFTNAAWTNGTPEPVTTLAMTWGQNVTDAFVGTDTLNAAILTGEKPTDSIFLPPLATNTTDAFFEAHYEGGWHNTIRFLEDLGSATVMFRGSFVCMWSASTYGLRTKIDSLVFSTRYYLPPTRNWGFDPRFSDINNMPPGTPFLSTGIYSNWLQPQ